MTPSMDINPYLSKKFSRKRVGEAIPFRAKSADINKVQSTFLEWYVALSDKEAR